MDNNGKPKARIIVYEENNRNFVHEYSDIKTGWYCRRCVRINTKRVLAVLNNGILEVPTKHYCKPLTVEESNGIQSSILKKLKKTGTASENSSPSVAASSNVKSKPNEAVRTAVAAPIPSSSKQARIPSGYREVLQNNRAVGYDAQGGRRKLVIVRDEDDDNMCREYANIGADWICIRCNKNSPAKAIVNLKTDEVFAPLHHTCKPITWDESRDNQLALINIPNQSRFNSSMDSTGGGSVSSVDLNYSHMSDTK